MTWNFKYKTFVSFPIEFCLTLEYSLQSKVPANPFGSPGNPFGDDESDEEEPIDSEKNVQIKFMRKEIKKLTNRGDHEKAEMVRQVLDEMINS